MSRTKIQWSEFSWNPVVGCTKVSAGCKNCYAERMAFRLNYMGNDNYFNVLNDSGWNGKTILVESALEIPMHWKNPRKIFVCSMGDLFHKNVPFEFIDKVMFTIYRSYRLGHTYQILTKRAERMLEYFSGDVDMRILNLFRKLDPKKYTSEARLTDSVNELSRVWLGVTAENQEMAEKRIPTLLQIPAAKRFVSVEPMLEKISLTTKFGDGRGYNPAACIYNDNQNDIDWVIIGCEKLAGGRAGRFADGFIDAAKDLVRQCKAAGVPVFVKQICYNGKVANDILLFPKELQIQEYPQKNLTNDYK